MKFLNSNKQNDKIINLAGLETCLVNGGNGNSEGKCTCYCGKNYYLDGHKDNTKDNMRDCSDYCFIEYAETVSNCYKIMPVKEELEYSNKNDDDNNTPVLSPFAPLSPEALASYII